MRTRHRWTLLLASALAVIGLSAVPAAAAPKPPPKNPNQAVAYQIGIGHDGYSADTTIAPPLHRRWVRDLNGPVSYPLIAGGRVFVTAVTDGSGATWGTTLYALDQVTGATLWSQAIPGSFFWSNAAYDAGHVFVLNADGLVQSFDAATGAEAWSTQLTDAYMFSAPPTADNGTVYIAGAGGGGTLYAVAESDGQVLWTQHLQGGDNSSPALSGTSVFVSYACGMEYAFDRVTGQPQWFNNGSCTGGGGETPVYHAGRVYSRDYLGVDNHILDAAGGTTLGTFQSDRAPAFSGTTGLFLSGGTLSASDGSKTLWRFTGDGTLNTDPIVVGSTAFVGSSNGKLYGLSLAKGKVVWSTTMGTPPPLVDQNVFSGPFFGLGAGQGLLVAPFFNRLVAYSR